MTFHLFFFFSLGSKNVKKQLCIEEAGHFGTEGQMRESLLDVSKIGVQLCACKCEIL